MPETLFAAPAPSCTPPASGVSLAVRPPMDAEAAGGNRGAGRMALPAGIAAAQRILVDDRCRCVKLDVREECAAVVGDTNFAEFERVCSGNRREGETELLRKPLALGLTVPTSTPFHHTCAVASKPSGFAASKLSV